MAFINALKSVQKEYALEYAKTLQVAVLGRVSSTQSWVWDKLEQNPQLDYCVVTDNQTNGYGKLNTKWQESEGKSLAFSWSCKFFTEDYLDVSYKLGQKLYVILNQSFGLNLNVKWPNDIMYKDCKLAGILTQCRKNAGFAQMVCGVGINVSSFALDGLNKVAFINDFSEREISCSDVFAAVIKSCIWETTQLA